MATDYPEALAPVDVDRLHDPPALRRRFERAYPPVEQDERDHEARRLLARYYRRLWAHARDLQDPTWWQRFARPDDDEDE